MPLTGSAKNLDWSGLNNGGSIYESPLSTYVTVALEYLTVTETRSSRRTFLLGSYLFSIFAIRVHLSLLGRWGNCAQPHCDAGS